MAQLREAAQARREDEKPILSKQGAENAEIERLAADAAHGERSALEALCANVAKGVLMRVRFLQHGDDTEDIAQEVLARMCENIHTLKDPKAFKGWLHKIVSHEVHNYQRKSGARGQLIYLDDTPQDIADEHEECLPHEQAIRKEEADIIMEIIETLPMQQREAVLWHYYDGMSVTETAKLMGIAQQNASRYLALARKKIHKDLMSRAKKTGNVRLNSITLVPMGVLIWQAMQQLGGNIAMVDSLWAEGAVASVMEKTATASAATKVSTGAVGVSSYFVYKLIAGIAIIALAIAAATVLILNNNTAPVQAVQSTALRVDGQITFTVENAFDATMNPTGVRVQAQSENGEMWPLNWWIVKVGSDETLYSGEGNSADSTLMGMLQRGEDGEYIITFFMEDSAGCTAWLKKQFTVQT